MECFVYRRLSWNLEYHEDLPCELSRVRRGGSTADAISDLIIDLDAADSVGDTAT